MYKITFYLLFIFGLSLAVSPADYAGTESMTFLLHNHVEPRIAALGGVVCGWGKTPSAVLVNPASIASNSIEGVSLSYGNYWEFFNAFGVVVSKRVSDASKRFVVAGLDGISYGEFDRMDENGNKIGTFSAGDFGIFAGYAQRISKIVSAGVSTRLLFSSLDTFSASAFVLGAGVYARFRRKKSEVGVSIRNIGIPLSKYCEDELSINPLISIGGSTRLTGFSGSVGGQVNISKSRGIKVGSVGLEPAIGFEFEPAKYFKVRFGYKLRPAPEDVNIITNGLSFGIGVTAKKFSFDYALGFYGDLGVVNIFSLKYWGI